MLNNVATSLGERQGGSARSVRSIRSLPAGKAAALLPSELVMLSAALIKDLSKGPTSPGGGPLSEVVELSVGAMLVSGQALKLMASDS